MIAAPLDIHEKYFFWFFAALWAFVLLLFGAVSLDYLPFVLVSSVCLGIGVLSLFNPSTLLYFVVIVCPIAGLVQSMGSIKVGSTDVTVSGFLWVFVALEGLTVMWFQRRKVRLRKELYLLLAFEVWVGVRWCLDPNLSGMKDVLFYGFPLLMGAYSFLVFSQFVGWVPGKIEKILLWSPLVPLAYFLIAIPAGIVVYDVGIGPIGPIDPRAISSFLLVILTLGVAAWRYDQSEKGARHGRFMSLLAILIIVFSLSRTATFIAILLLGLSKINPRKPQRALLILALSGVLAVLVFALVPQLRSRVFTSGATEPSDDFSLGEIDTQGRALFWATTYADAIERPIIGWGLGSARLLVASVFPGGEWEAYHPHNEYLQVFHDMGFIGLVLMAAAWISLLVRYWKAWRTSHQVGKLGQAKWDLAAFLALLSVLLSVVTGNELHYAFVTGPTFVILALSEYHRNARNHPAFASATRRSEANESARRP